MISERTKSNLYTAAKILLAAILLAFVIWIAAVGGGCSTVTPDRVQSKQASYDGNQQNSGFLGFFADGSGHISPAARDRYNELIAIYGNDFLMPLKPDAGIVKLEDGTYQIDAQHLSAFLQMNDKHRAGIKPNPTR